MGVHCSVLFLLLHLNLFLLLGVVSCADEFSRLDFPSSPDFVFGSGTSAYQYEAATSEDGRTPSLWDSLFQDGSGYASGDIAADGYHKYKEDVQLMVETGLEAYRFSISWTRLIPHGRGPVNPKGLDYYNNLINELVKHGIEPHVTLVHFDGPLDLEDEYGGWRSPKMINDFTAYANMCFSQFGDRVKHWSTVNEANLFVLAGYDMGIYPPGRCSDSFGCRSGNSSTEPYIVMHNMLLGHASAARLYKKKYQNKQNGFVGINLAFFTQAPYKNMTEDATASAQIISEVLLGWILSPLVYGHYPEVMKERVGSRLPSFTKLECDQVKGSFDFIGLNYYFAAPVKDHLNNSTPRDWVMNSDMGIDVDTEEITGNPKYEYPVQPSSMLDLLEYIKLQYGNPPVYIHENGQRMKKEGTWNDISRITYLHNYIGTMLDAVRNGVNVKGYFCWSFVDLMEIAVGYDASFGLYYVDLKDGNLKRYPKRSAYWYSDFLKGRNTTWVGNFEIEGKCESA